MTTDTRRGPKRGVKRGPYKKKAPRAALFWAKVDPFGPVSEYVPHLGRCWLWLAATTKGYGRFGVDNGKVVVAHRYSYELFVGPIPEGMTLDHLCFNPSCVNPRHLEPVSGPENTRRAGRAGRMTERWNKGWDHCRAGHAYTDETVRLDPNGHRHCRICDQRNKEKRSEERRLVRIEKYGYDPGPFARFNPAKAVRT